MTDALQIQQRKQLMNNLRIEQRKVNALPIETQTNARFQRNIDFIQELDDLH